MTMRTLRSTVTFAAPFQLKNFEQPQPAGTYQVDTDEEVIEGNDRTAYRRIATFFYMRDGANLRIRQVDPADLQEAVERDQAKSAG